MAIFEADNGPHSQKISLFPTQNCPSELKSSTYKIFEFCEFVGVRDIYVKFRNLPVQKGFQHIALVTYFFLEINPGMLSSNRAVSDGTEYVDKYCLENQIRENISQPSDYQLQLVYKAQFFHYNRDEISSVTFDVFPSSQFQLSQVTDSLQYVQIIFFNDKYPCLLFYYE